MAGHHRPYPAEFRQRMLDLVRAGRKPAELAKKFELSAQTIGNWVKQDNGRRSDGLTSEEQAEVRRLRREVRQLREEREILKKTAAWFARETESIWWIATLPQSVPTSFGWLTSPTSPPGQVFCFWPWCSMRSVGALSAGRWPITCAPSWCSMR